MNILIILGVIAIFFSELEDYGKYFEEMGAIAVTSLDTDEEVAKQAEKEMEEKMEDMPFILTALFSGITIILLLPLGMYYFYATYRSMSVRITEKNFPEIYEIVKEYTEKLGLKEIPPVYLVQGNGILNAFTSSIPFKQYVELYADLVEVAYREHQDMDTLRFIIGHEMAHMYLKHATLHYNYFMIFSTMIPILGSTASRAREYSCDRIAQLLSGSDGIDAMMTLTAGIHLYKKVDGEDYLEHAKNTKGFFLWWYNLLCDHPVMCKRVMALAMKEGNGKLY